MVDAAEYRKGIERYRSSRLMALALNKPDELDNAAPKPDPPRRGPVEQRFVEEQWW